MENEEKIIRKAVWVSPSTHLALKKFAVDKTMTFDEVIAFLLNNVQGDIPMADLRSAKKK